MSEPVTHLDLVEEMKLPRWSGDVGQQLIGLMLGIVNDWLADAESVAALSGLSTLPLEQPLDAVDELCNECLRPHYPGETYASARARELAKWDHWSGSPMAGLIAELNAAGYTGFTIRMPNDTALPMPAGYWSGFWIDFPQGTHPVTGPGATRVGNYVVGRDRIGPAGINTQQGHVYWRRLLAIVGRNKPVDWVLWTVRFYTGVSNGISLMGRARSTTYDTNYDYEF